MIFKKKKHLIDLYSILLSLSRNKFFYENVKLPDTFETRILLMFFHFSLMMIIFKKKGHKLDQGLYDFLFHSIENDLRELGYGDVTVNKKMKDLNKILYDILLKIEEKDSEGLFKINTNLVSRYFKELNDDKRENLVIFNTYFFKFFDFCFDLPLKNMIQKSINFKY